MNYPADKATGNAKTRGDFQQRWRARANLKTLSQQGHQPQPNIFTAALADVLGLFLLHVHDAILEGVSDLRTEQNDEPGEIQANEENGNECQGRAIDRAHIHHLAGENGAESTNNKPEGAADDSANDGGTPVHLGIRDDLVKQGKGDTDEHERQCFHE